MTDTPHILIVGASRGLGHALAAEYSRQGWRVTGTVRDDGGAARLRALDGVAIERLDITDAAAVDALAARTPPASLDLLLVNAGVSGDIGAAAGAVPVNDWIAVMRTNAYAPLHLIEKMHGTVKARGIVAVMSSILGSVALNERGTWESYRMSKAALNTGLRSAALRIGTSGQAFVAVAPGWVRTDMGGPEATLSVQESIPGVVAMLTAQQGIGGSRFLDYQGQTLPW